MDCLSHLILTKMLGDKNYYYFCFIGEELEEQREEKETQV